MLSCTSTFVKMIVGNNSLCSVEAPGFLLAISSSRKYCLVGTMPHALFCGNFPL